MDYTLYHDESKVDGFWHGILLVPNSKKAELINLLNTVRKNTNYQSELGIKKVKNERSKITRCASGFINVGVASLISNNKGKPYPIDLFRNDKGSKEYETLYPNIGAKFILFRERDNKTVLENYPDFGSIVETTFRFGLKGGLHFLGNHSDTIIITGLHFDGHEHYNRLLDRNRIVSRLHGLRSYCSISNVKNIIDDRKSNHEKEGAQSYEDCQLLQLVDLMIGAFRSNLGFATKDLHKKIGYPTRILFDKYCKGYKRMSNSRWANSLCFSQCHHSSGGWVFEQLELKQDIREKQLNLGL
ncbi:hypothetical protein [Labilibaculum sp.]|uniref:hypothetical protein n=1 Tax=Labilibaculum sp. TaxID=2060723 RepID=UPI00356AC845